MFYSNNQGERCTTLINSKNGSRNDATKQDLDPLLGVADCPPLEIVAIDLQEHLILGCGIFKIAAVDAVVKNHMSGNPTPVNESVKAFVQECQMRDIPEQNQWGQKWRDLIRANKLQ